MIFLQIDGTTEKIHDVIFLSNISFQIQNYMYFEKHSKINLQSNDQRIKFTDLFKKMCVTIAVYKTEGLSKYLPKSCCVLQNDVIKFAFSCCYFSPSL